MANTLVTLIMCQALFQALYTHSLTCSLQKASDVGTVIVPCLCVRKLKHKGMK